jgi:N-acyl amino acid synthase FeeM
MLRIKRAHSAPLRDEVYSLRYRAYRKEDAIEPRESEAFEDQYDHQPNHVLWALTLEEKVVGSIRTTWFDSAEKCPIPEMHAYANEIANVIPAGTRVLSGNRLVTDPDLASISAQIVLLLLRHYMVVAKRKADWAIAAARSNHLPFYRRVLHLERASVAKEYPGLRCPMHLMACDFQKNIVEVIDKTPLLKPRGYEQIFLDPNYADVWEIGLPVET